MDTKASGQPASDDQEIAKVLAGVNEQIGKDQATGLHFEETASDGAAVPNTPLLPTPPLTISPPSGSMLPPVPPITPTADPVAPPAPAQDDDNKSAVAVDPALEGIKNDALSELRPLVDKLNVSAEEKFDTYLLLLRSTDDKSLIGPAHEAAKGIADEARRAQALLDIIKEIDYLSHHAA